MEPQLATPEFQNGSSSENEPVLPNFEVVPNVLPNPEAPIVTPEQGKNAEQLSVDHQGFAAPIVQQQSVALPTTDGQTQGATVTSVTPPVARDEDVIEKEWISKVKSVISSTSDDPHKQQSMMSRLMADYVLKRYDRKIGETES